VYQLPLLQWWRGRDPHYGTFGQIDTFRLGTGADGAALSGVGAGSVGDSSFYQFLPVHLLQQDFSFSEKPFFLGGSNCLSLPFQVQAGRMYPISPHLWHMANLVQLSSLPWLRFPPETVRIF
jgi:hypothetical protein